MTHRSCPQLPALALAVSCLTLAPVQAAPALFEQLPLGSLDAVATASKAQAGLLVQSFSFSGSAASLSWWGTFADPQGFEVSLQPGAGTAPDLSKPWTVTRDGLEGQIGIQVLVDADGDPDTPMELQVQTFDVYRYSIDLGTLSGGDYSLGVWETTDDLTWFWLHGAPMAPDTLSRSWDYEPPRVEPFAEANAFALSLHVDGGRGTPVPEPASALLVAAALGALTARPQRRRGPAV